MSEKEGVKKISDWERKRREHNLRQSIASVELEGFLISDEEKAEDQRYIDGEITFSELTEIRDARLRKWVESVRNK